MALQFLTLVFVPRIIRTWCLQRGIWRQLHSKWDKFHEYRQLYWQQDPVANSCVKANASQIKFDSSFLEITLFFRRVIYCHHSGLPCVWLAGRPKCGTYERFVEFNHFKDSISNSVCSLVSTYKTPTAICGIAKAIRLWFFPLIAISATSANIHFNRGEAPSTPIRNRIKSAYRYVDILC